jgi:cobalt-zinc-cadmium efflux system membrane fusion protein
VLRGIAAAAILIPLFSGIPALAASNHAHQDHGEKASTEAHSAHDHDDHKEKPGHEREHNEHENAKQDDHSPKEHAHDHDGRGEKDQSDDHAVRLTAAVMREFGVKTEQAKRGPIAKTISRPAEISYNFDQYAHVVPRIAGIAKSINAKQGDRVKSGQLLAVLDSLELAELKAAYLASVERFDQAEQEYDRLRKLRKRRMALETSYLTARSVFVEARIAMRSARQKLSSIGISHRALKQLVNKSNANLTRYPLRSPMDGVVIARHLVKGEMVSDRREAFVIADLASVWVDISIYPSDLPLVRSGQQVELKTETGERAMGQSARCFERRDHELSARHVHQSARVCIQVGCYRKSAYDRPS